MAKSKLAPKFLQFVAPSAWASYLINGDASGIDSSEKHAAHTFVNRIGCGFPVDANDAGFVRVHDAWAECPLSADCQTYTFHNTPGAIRA